MRFKAEPSLLDNLQHQVDQAKWVETELWKGWYAADNEADSFYANHVECGAQGCRSCELSQEDRMRHHQLEAKASSLWATYVTARHETVACEQRLARALKMLESED